MSDSPRFALPLLNAGQAQKEVSHNEAIVLIDAMLAPSAIAAGINVPPDTPEPGQCWIVGTAPTGAWAGWAEALAMWTDGGWRFVSPRLGLRITMEGNGLVAAYGDAGWSIGVLAGSALRIGGDQVVGARLSAIAAPAGGSTVDVEARAAIDSILFALRTHGLIATTEL
ncbi:DUF2793 domain-containing protein [Sphingomonas sp.]|uniref:DUF2793 domain-containing protein n=1 Tax=Sphingomonas sp. TaxID=28214 RepID=UPI001ED3FCF7|nr:DUF2793 domain-containing protein [Sphingomonas sp.]MBX3593720.1 DUF2793 domain-containing protein [Sphingomonas sp.]